MKHTIQSNELCDLGQVSEPLWAVVRISLSRSYSGMIYHLRVSHPVSNHSCSQRRTSSCPVQISQ